MTVENIRIEESIERVRHLLSLERDISPTLKAAIEVIILALTLVLCKYLITRDDDIKGDSDIVRHLSKYKVEVITVSNFLKLFTFNE